MVDRAYLRRFSYAIEVKGMSARQRERVLDLTDELIDAICDTGVPYFDLSLQHVSPPLLRRMRRWGSGDVFLDRIAAIAREETQPLLLLCKILGPNPRALVLGLSMFAGTPAYYMVYQSVVLNLLLVWSVSRHNAAAKRIAARIAG